MKDDLVAEMRGGTKIDLGHGNEEWKKLEDEGKSKGSMDEDMFDTLKHKQEMGITSLQCSVEHGLDIKQVNVAFSVSKYDTYLEFASMR